LLEIKGADLGGEQVQAGFGPIKGNEDESGAEHSEHQS